MKILGFHVPFTARKAAAPRQRRQPQTLEMVGERGTWRSLFDWRPGSWQQHDLLSSSDEIQEGTNTAIVYACVRRLAGDIGKMGAVIQRLVDGIWTPGTHQVWSRLIRRPNRFQTWGLFIKSWLYSLLLAGNAYVAKLYNARGEVEELVVLDPTTVTPHVTSDTGEVWYRVGGDPLAKISDEALLIAAEDMIHHPYMALTHPLVGTSPLARALMASKAREGIVANSAELTENGAVPPLVITVPEGTPKDQLKAIADKWKEMPKHRAAVVDASIKVDQLMAKYVDSQASEIAALSGLDICAAFDVPPWKVGLEAAPSGNIEDRQITYYQDSLQWIVEDIEDLLDAGLGLPPDTALEFDEANLLRLDSKTRAEVDAMLIKGVAAPNEIRRKWNLPKVKGGDSVYMQQQNYSLEALHKRDQAAPAPAGGGTAPPAKPGANPDPNSEDEPADPTARAPSLPWVGVWDKSREYPTNCGFVTHNGALWARVERCVGSADCVADHSERAEVGAEPGTDAGAPYWQLAVMRGKAPTQEGV